MRDDSGSALVVVLLCTTLFLVLVGALVAVASTEATVAATFRDSTAALAGAEAGIVRALGDFVAAPDVNALLRASATSGFVDGPAASPRRLPDGTTLDLVATTNIERCGFATCSDAQLAAVTSDRPWGINNARWEIFGSGWLRDLAGPPIEAPHVYVVVWVGDDPLETDGDPRTDAADPEALGHDVVLMRAVAFAAHSVRRRVEVVARRQDGRVRILSWREVR